MDTPFEIARGEWLLVLRYTNMESAHKAGRSDTSDISQTFMQMSNMHTMSASFYTLVSE